MVSLGSTEDSTFHWWESWYIEDSILVIFLFFLTLNFSSAYTHFLGLYDSLKPFLAPLENNPALLGFASFMLGWGITIGASMASYPIDTVRRRIFFFVSCFFYFILILINFVFLNLV
jgi:hypothetical protein